MLVLIALYHLQSIVKLMFNWATTYILFVKFVKWIILEYQALLEVSRGLSIFYHNDAENLEKLNRD